jgi:murein DD-endopeptidase MepM/ murein hydrolase activator NlpD
MMSAVVMYQRFVVYVRRLFVLVFITVFLLSLAIGNERAPGSNSTDVKKPVATWEPGHPVNGSIFLVRVALPADLKSLKGSWMGHQVFFSFDSSRRAWFGLAGTDLDTSAGDYPLVLQAINSNGSEISYQQVIPVAQKRYTSIALRVAGKFTKPDAAILARVQEETALKNQVFAVRTPERLWSGNFGAPVASTTSDSFGTRRTFNGEVKSVHRGLDYRAQPGTPVEAINSGKVVLARDLFYEGRCVVLDHGQGLVSIYMHLSQIDVHEGDQVKRGQVVGLSGATGRVTGPHLHIGVRWQDIYVDPAALLELKLPGL